ncbi:hypothetical protein Q1695_014344 [Nippostrongylus brasiliensis]|nr:hypothetical protein Q1695_014344 [Nippostrongylus brasiliensis]
MTEITLANKVVHIVFLCKRMSNSQQEQLNGNESLKQEKSGKEGVQAPPPFDRAQHKKEVKKMKLLKHKRKMKMSQRADDVQRDSCDSEEFVAGSIPQEAPQDTWLNDLICTDKTKSEKSISSVRNRMSSARATSSRRRSFKQEKEKLSDMMKKAMELISKHPVEAVLIVLVLVVVLWFHRRSKKSHQRHR